MGTAKKWQPEDEFIRDALAKMVRSYEGSAREVARRSGLDQSRLRTILDGSRGPASVGEAIRIAEAVGRQASDVIRTIEHAVADYRFAHPGTEIPLSIEIDWDTRTPPSDPEGPAPDGPAASAEPAS